VGGGDSPPTFRRGRENALDGLRRFQRVAADNEGCPLPLTCWVEPRPFRTCRLHPAKQRSPELLLELTRANRFLSAVTVLLSLLKTAAVTPPLWRSLSCCCLSAGPCEASSTGASSRRCAAKDRCLRFSYRVGNQLLLKASSLLIGSFSAPRGIDARPHRRHRLYRRTDENDCSSDEADNSGPGFVAVDRS
jgi:hypothetical protein